MIASAQEFIGQERARALLARYIERGRLSGTFLLMGQRGLGKSTLATIIARALCCTGERGSADPLGFCGRCYACRSIAANEQPEYVTVRPTGQNISVKYLDEEHGGLATALYHPNLLSHRVFLIDDAHYLNEESGNRLLKLFEEAPARTVFLLTTDRPELLLPTIHSRGQRIALTALATQPLAKALQAQGIEPQAAAEAALLSGGRIVDALALSGNAVWRSELRALAQAIARRRGVPEAAARAMQHEHTALWEKEVSDHGMEEAELEKQLPKARQNELIRQALISAYDRASWLLLNAGSGTGDPGPGTGDPQSSNRDTRHPASGTRTPAMINMDEWEGAAAQAAQQGAGTRDQGAAGSRTSRAGGAAGEAGAGMSNRPAAANQPPDSRHPARETRHPNPGPLNDPAYLKKLATLRRRIAGNVDRELAQLAFEAAL